MGLSQKSLIDLVKYPILTEKTIGLIEQNQYSFAIDAKANKGEKVFNKVLDTDEGARRLGEVALVPDSSPISQSNILFYNTLFDENAACHIALGQCYSKCFKNFESYSVVLILGHREKSLFSLFLG